MDLLTVEHCKEFERYPMINPLTQRTIKIGGPMFMTLVETCNELKRKETATVKHTSLINIKDFKQIILSELDILRKDEIANENIFKARAYEKVIKGIQLIDYPILTWDDLKHVEGIGGKIEAKIKQILKEGSLFRAQEIRSHPRTAALQELMDVHGIGSVKAKQLYKQGIHSIESLRHAVREQPDLLNNLQKIGLKYVEDFQERIPREEIQKHERILRKAMKGTSFMFDIVGSYRRGSESSGDIDVLLTLPKGVINPVSKFYDLVQSLKDAGYLIDTLGEGEKKYLGVAKIPRHKPRRIDLLLTPKEEYPFALLSWTGSDAFNIRVRTVAIEKGYSLNESGLQVIKRSKERLPEFHSEKDILEFLIGEYVPPEERN